MGAIIVLADDLSGAAELAGIAVARGLTAEVQRRFEPKSQADVIAVDTDSRSLSASDAAARVAAVTRAVLAVQPTWIYKKVDSVLRGNVRAEIEAILDVTGQRRAVLIPANPSRGRVIAGGRYLIGGVPLHETSFARDPEFPRTSADVAVLLGGKSSGAREIEVPDVQTMDDLRQVAAEIDEHVLAAGAADFFTELIEARVKRQARAPAANVPTIRRPALLVCGSRQAWPQRKRECLAAGIPFIEMAGGWQGVIHWEGLVLAFAISEDAVGTSSELLAELATETVKIIQPPLATLLAEGGATAEALAGRLGWTRFAVESAIADGVGALRPLDSAFAPLFVIKPGSYPWPVAIWNGLGGNGTNGNEGNEGRKDG